MRRCCARRGASLLLAGVCSALIACSDEPSGGEGGAGDCEPGEFVLADGTCVRPGLPSDLPCPPGEWLRQSDAACVAAGVPPDGCGEGFVHDGDHGCEPVLAPQPCAPGLMAVPGEDACHEPATCDPGPFGSIPGDATTEYVDQSYAGGASDGTLQRPWTTIQDGVDAAAPGAIVAVASGSYPEDVNIAGSAVRLWGRCPDLVEIVGTGVAVGAVFVRGGAAGTEIRSLAITGAGAALVASGAQPVLVEGVWIHDTGNVAIDIEVALGPAEVTIRGSLVERTEQLGLLMIGATATIEQSVIRDSSGQSFGVSGIGIQLQPASNGAPAVLTVRRTLFERHPGANIAVIGSTALVEASVLRDTVPTGPSPLGRGMTVQVDPITLARSSVQLRTSLLERNHDLGVEVLGSDLDVEATVVRDTQFDFAGATGGRAIEVQHDPGTGATASVTLRTSLIDANRDVGILAAGAPVVIDATRIRDTLPFVDGLGGRAISIQRFDAVGLPASLTIDRSVVERNRELGAFVYGSDVVAQATVVRDTSPNGIGVRGRGFQIQHGMAGEPATGTVRACLLERNGEGAIVLSGPGTLTVDACELRDTLNVGEVLGDGIVAWSDLGPAQATITSTRIENSDRAAMASFGANVSVASTQLLCQAFDLASEPWASQPGTFVDLGGVSCGCPEPTGSCTALSYALAPPPPLDPPP